MVNVDYFLLVRLGLGLVGGFLLARRLRGAIRAIAVRSLPVRYRISEDSFRLQTRLSAFLAFSIVLVAGGLVFWGLGKVHRWIGAPFISRTEQMEIVPAPPPVSATPYEESSPVAVARDTVGTTVPTPAPAGETPPRESPEQYFCQLYAFREEDRAWTQQAIWEQKLSRAVWVGTRPGEEAPYKVLVGPFDHRREAVRYLRQQKLEGFPRPAKEMRLYAR